MLILLSSSFVVSESEGSTRDEDGQEEEEAGEEGEEEEKEEEKKEKDEEEEEEIPSSVFCMHVMRDKIDSSAPGGPLRRLREGWTKETVKVEGVGVGREWECWRMAGWVRGWVRGVGLWEGNESVGGWSNG